MAGLILRTVLALNDPSDTAIEDIARRWIAATRSEDGVVGFHGFVDHVNGNFVFLEHYRDSEAFMVHRGLVDPALRAELYAVASFASLDVYGDPSDQVRAALAPVKPAVFAHVASR